MDLRKFVSLVEERALFFCRADRFDDRFEGSYPRGAAVEAALQQIVAAAANDPKMPGRIQGARRISSCRKQFRQSVLINCWHINERESAAMWKLYIRSDKGIALKSTVQRLIDGVRCEENLCAARRYISNRQKQL